MQFRLLLYKHHIHILYLQTIDCKRSETMYAREINQVKVNQVFGSASETFIPGSIAAVSRSPTITQKATRLYTYRSGVIKPRIYVTSVTASLKGPFVPCWSIKTNGDLQTGRLKRLKLRNKMTTTPWTCHINFIVSFHLSQFRACDLYLNEIAIHILFLWMSFFVKNSIFNMWRDFYINFKKIKSTRLLKSSDKTQMS